MDLIHLAFSISLVLAIGLVLKFLYKYTKLPAIIGYILGGILISPYLINLVKIEEVHIIRDIGVIVLMFSIGLFFNLRKLRRVGYTVFFAGIFEILFVFIVSYQIAILFGFGELTAIFLSALMSISSTILISHFLIENKFLGKEFSYIVLGLLVIEDFAAVIFITLLSTIAMTGTWTLKEVFDTIFRLVLFAFSFLAIGMYFVPKFINYITRFGSNVSIFLSLVLCFFFSILIGILGFPVAIGALITGIIVAEAKQKIRKKILAIRDIFLILFFFAIGMQINLFKISSHAPIVFFVFLLAFIFAKFFSCSVGVFLSGKGVRNSLSVGLSMLAIGEFSFVIASFGLEKKVINNEIYSTAVFLCLATSLILSYSVNSANKLEEKMRKTLPIRTKAFISYINSLLCNLLTMQKTNERTIEIKNKIENIFINLFIIIFILTIARAVYSFRTTISSFVGISEIYFLIFVIIVFILLLIVPIKKLLTNTIKFIDITTSLLFYSSKEKKIEKKVLHRILRDLTIFLLLILMLIFSTPILLTLAEIGIFYLSTIILLIALCIYFLWDSIHVFHERIEEIFRRPIKGE